MKGAYTKRKVNKILQSCKKSFSSFFYEVKRFFVKRFIKNKDFSIISNNCWAGRVYQYLDMPYLSPTAGLYFFAPDYIKFVKDLKGYLDTPLEFISPEESKYFDELKKRNQLEKPIGRLGDIEIVFLHYSSKEETLEKWNRRKERVNFEHIILKFSRMDLCTEKEIEEFDAIKFNNKFVFNNRKPLKFNSEVYWNEQWHEEGILRDTTPFPGNANLVQLLNKNAESYPENGL